MILIIIKLKGTNKINVHLFFSNLDLFELLDTIPIALIVFFVSGIIGLTVYFTSKFDEAPLYHWAFGYFGFCVSVMWIYGLANEVVDMLQAIGIMFSLSDVILGLTLLAWGNSLSGNLFLYQIIV